MVNPAKAEFTRIIGHGLSHARLVLVICGSSPRVKCAIIGVTSKEPLDENLAG
jgi:hypothetical protein